MALTVPSYTVQSLETIARNHEQSAEQAERRAAERRDEADAFVAEAEDHRGKAAEMRRAVLELNNGQ